MQYIHMHYTVQEGFVWKFASGKMPRPSRRGESREAIVDAAARLFLERGFGSVSMDELAEAAGLARRTLYNQFASKEEIFREMLLRVSGQLEHAFPPGIETEGDVEDVLRLIARMILDLHENPGYLGFLRMVVADSRQFPWIAEEFAAVMDPQTERLDAICRSSDRIGHSGLPQSDAGGASVHGDPQRVFSVALDDGSRTRPVPDEDWSKRPSGCSCNITGARDRKSTAVQPSIARRARPYCLAARSKSLLISSIAFWSVLGMTDRNGPSGHRGSSGARLCENPDAEPDQETFGMI